MTLYLMFEYLHHQKINYRLDLLFFRLIQYFIRFIHVLEVVSQIIIEDDMNFIRLQLFHVTKIYNLVLNSFSFLKKSYKNLN